MNPTSSRCSTQLQHRQPSLLSSQTARQGPRRFLAQPSRCVASSRSFSMSHWLAFSSSGQPPPSLTSVLLQVELSCYHFLLSLEVHCSLEHCTIAALPYSAQRRETEGHTPSENFKGRQRTSCSIIEGPQASACCIIYSPHCYNSFSS